LEFNRGTKTHLMIPSSILERLITLTHELGRPELKLSILAEGNVSAHVGNGTFFVKASGGQMATIGANGVKNPGASSEALQAAVWG
jgi:hypothetical protein